MTPLLSIVVPTRDRQFFAARLVALVLATQSDRIELVVRDTSGTDELRDQIGSHLGDSRLRYQHTAPSGAMSDDFDAAVAMAGGEYICFLGDDDAINPEAIRVLEWAQAQHIDALWNRPIADYFWPDVSKHERLRDQAAKLYARACTGAISYHSPEAEMLKCVRRAGQRYYQLGLPRIYHGFVRRACLEQVRARTGSYIKGLSPDVYGALTVANYTRRLCSLDYPLVMGGTCAASGAGSSSAGKHKGDLKDAPLLRGKQGYVWSDEVPRFYSVQTIWADSALAALRAIGRDDLLARFNLPLLMALCAVHHPDYLSSTLRAMPAAFRTSGVGNLRGAAQVVESLVSSQAPRAARALARRLRKGPSGPACIGTNLADTSQAMDALLQHLHTSGVEMQLDGVTTPAL